MVTVVLRAGSNTGSEDRTLAPVPRPCSLDPQRRWRKRGGPSRGPAVGGGGLRGTATGGRKAPTRGEMMVDQAGEEVIS